MTLLDSLRLAARPASLPSDASRHLPSDAPEVPIRLPSDIPRSIRLPSDGGPDLPSDKQR